MNLSQLKCVVLTVLSSVRRANNNGWHNEVFECQIFYSKYKSWLWIK